VAEESSAEPGELLARLIDGELRALLRLLDGSDVEELELEMGAVRFAFRRDLSDVAPSSAEPTAASDEDQAGTPLVAERVGFFHFPDAVRPQVGDSIKAGQVVGVIDSLNVPSPVAASLGGRIAQVLVDDGQPVEYGQPLLLIEPEER
jgi:biotin carboxyl carrier protein